MLKKLHVLLLVLLAAVCFYRHRMGRLRLHRAVRRYGDAQHGGWQPAYHREAGVDAAGALPYGQELKIGVPNGSIRDVVAQTDNIERLDFDNSYMYVYLDRALRGDRDDFPSPTRGCRSICISSAPTALLRTMTMFTMTM